MSIICTDFYKSDLMLCKPLYYKGLQVVDKVKHLQFMVYLNSVRLFK
jgi:hypothetical protein